MQYSLYEGYFINFRGFLAVGLGIFFWLNHFGRSGDGEKADVNGNHVIVLY